MSTPKRRTPMAPSGEVAQSVKSAVAALAALEKGLGITVPPLTASQKKHTARFKKGGEAVVAVIGSLARQNGLESSVLQVDAMNEQLAVAQALAPLVAKLAAISTRVDDVVFDRRAAAWQTAMQFYALLQRLARGNVPMTKGLEPVTKFMSMHDPRKKRAAGEPTRASQKAAKKAVAVLAKNAPDLLAPPTKTKK